LNNAEHAYKKKCTGGNPGGLEKKSGAHKKTVNAAQGNDARLGEKW